ncbi:rhodanese-like domain-containing protein [Scytonema sp. UIC 10036]|uniref:rhodanese-like domain-containing protein n=1 Tax=Scytonema sp. UIC 10036 TaxID=2304196 RepID=UPI0012DAD3B8|nr:rhodanese-like domain-containing protein [Scytonema sp. UIC 10036]MUH00973.1 rhodanese-like domain-containing protein [Scytonema sp. UIC 10036]
MENTLLGTFASQSDAHDIKSRLEWGQPGFTIVDVRDRKTYNQGHISGAIPIPLDDLTKRATSLAKSRHIYIYGESDEQSAHAAQTLREAGFTHVGTIAGGLAAWKAAGGAVEGV